MSPFSFFLSFSLKAKPQLAAVFALVVPKTTPGYAGGKIIASSEE